MEQPPFEEVPATKPDRRRIVRDVKEVRAQFDKGLAKPGTVDEIMREIEAIEPLNP